jgi:hypothetical protein
MHATNKRHATEAAEIQRLYQAEGWAMARLAAHYGCGGSTIRRRLRKLGSTARRRGPHVDRTRVIDWSPEVAYAVGIIATDGNLAQDGRHLSVTSKDIQLLDTVRACLKLNVSITPASVAKSIFHLQWSDRVRWEWLAAIGLMPAKSLRLRALAVPDVYFADCMRGCIDGDGTILSYTDRYLTAKSEKDVYQRLFVSIVSASAAFLGWMQARAATVIGVRGALYCSRPASEHAALWQLKYAKRESMRLLHALYYQPNVPCLRRKQLIALPFLPAD